MSTRPAPLFGSDALLVGSENSSLPATLWLSRRHRLITPALSGVLLAALVAAWSAPAAHAQAVSTTPNVVYGQLGSFTSDTAGVGASGLDAPQSVALDSSGNLRGRL
jgi:hypothetical protein